MTKYDLDRINKYSENMADYRLIKDLMPRLASFAFDGRLNTRLSISQSVNYLFIRICRYLYLLFLLCGSVVKNFPTAMVGLRGDGLQPTLVSNSTVLVSKFELWPVSVVCDCYLHVCPIL